LAGQSVKFGPVPICDAEGALLGPGQRIAERRLAKGHSLSTADLQAAADAGLSTNIVARLDDGDVPENLVAETVSAALIGPGIKTSKAVHGRVNLLAVAAGLLQFDTQRAVALNLVDEAITVAVLPPMSRVCTGDVVATVKIIPYAVPNCLVQLARARAAESPISVAAFCPADVDLIKTRLPGQTGAIFSKTTQVTRARIVRDCVCPHDKTSLSGVLRIPTNTAITLVAAGSATVDRADVIPAAIVAAGG
jgi:molybdenum cofactor cytidylyltransferase